MYWIHSCKLGIHKSCWLWHLTTLSITSERSPQIFWACHVLGLVCMHSHRITRTDMSLDTDAKHNNLKAWVMLSACFQPAHSACMCPPSSQIPHIHTRKASIWQHCQTPVILHILQNLRAPCTRVASPAHLQSLA